MARINLLTLHYADNNGSALQAYATCALLRRLGHTVTVINLQNRQSVFARFRHPGNWLCWPRYLRFAAFRRRFLSPMTARMFAWDSRLIPAADYTVVGSDQVWNPDFKSVRRGAYFLPFVSDGSRKLALSSSFGKECWDAPEAFTEQVRGYLQDFDALSVREADGVEICRRQFGLEAVQLVDPTLALGDFSELLTRPERPSGELRCFLFKTRYSFDVVDEVARREHLPVRAVGRNAKSGYRRSPYWCQSPVDWLYMMRDAALWVSDSFHGVALAIVQHKPFIALCGEEKKLSRLRSLLALFGLERKLVMSLDDLRTRYDEVMAPVDWDRVDAVLHREQARFEAFVWEHIR